MNTDKMPSPHPRSGPRSAEVRHHLSKSAVHLKKHEPEVALQHATTALSIIEETQDEQYLDLAVEMLCTSNQHLGRLEEATAWAERGLALHQAAGRQELIASHLGMVGMLLQERRLYEQAEGPLLQAVRLARTLRLDKVLGGSQVALSQVYASLGRTEDAVRCLAEGVSAMERAGHIQGHASAQVRMAILRNEMGQQAEAVALLTRAIPVLRQVGDLQTAGVALLELAEIRARQGDLRAVIECHEQQRAVARARGDRAGEGNLLHAMGELWQRIGSVPDAAACFSQCLDVAREVKSGEFEGLALYGIATTCGDIDIALVAYLKALPLLEEARQHGKLASALSNLGALLLQEDEAAAALQHLPRAAALCREVGSAGLLALALLNLGEAYGKVGQPGAAIEPLTEAQALFSAEGRQDMAETAAELLAAARLAAEADAAAPPRWN